MGILSALLGQDNPAAKWAGDNRNWLGAVGSSIAGGFKPVDYASASARDQQQAQEAEKTNRTKAWLAQAFPDIASQVEAGLPVEQGFSLALQQMGPKAQPDPIKLSAGDILFDPATQQPIYTAPAQDKPKDPPTGYQWEPDGQLQYIPGGPADPSTAGKTTEATRRNQQLAKVIIPEMQTLDQNWAALSDLKNQAFGAAGVTNGLTTPEYQRAKNSLRTIIASYLYSVSGATANPGEVENQASILTPQVGDSPQAVADKLARVKSMVQAVTDAAQGGNMPPAQPQGDGETDSILKKYGL